MHQSQVTFTYLWSLWGCTSPQLLMLVLILPCGDVSKPADVGCNQQWPASKLIYRLRVLSIFAPHTKINLRAGYAIDRLLMMAHVICMYSKGTRTNVRTNTSKFRAKERGDDGMYPKKSLIFFATAILCLDFLLFALLLHDPSIDACPLTSLNRVNDADWLLTATRHVEFTHNHVMMSRSLTSSKEISNVRRRGAEIMISTTDISYAGKS